MPEGFHGYGTTIGVGNGASPEVFTPVGAVTKIKIPGFESTSIDVSHLTTGDSDKTRRFIAGMITLGKVPFTCIYSPANSTQKNAGSGLIALGLAQTIKNWQIVLSDEDESVWEFEAWVSKCDPGEAGLDSQPSLDCELTLTGDRYVAP